MVTRQINKVILTLGILLLFSSFLLAQNQAIQGWGRDNYNQISGIPEGTDFIDIAAKGDFSLALRQNGSLIAWGDNTYGQGNVPAGNDFVAIATGNFHSLAVREDGTIAAWGRDNDNQVSGAPTGSNFVAVSGGYYHSLALREDGSIAGWGANSYGQSTPPAGNDFAAVEAGGFHSIALRENGTIVAWGRNWNNVLTVPTGNNFVAISAGYYQNIALRSDGTVVVWGSNEYGQVASTPTTNDFIAISTGLGHSMALREDGSITCWGAGEEGATGLFDYGQSIDPEGNDFVGLAAGRVHSLALVQTGPPTEFTLTIELLGQGETDPEPGNYVYDVGTEVSITAIQTIPEWPFSHWDIDGEMFTANPVAVEMLANILVTANFIYLSPPQNLTATAGNDVVYLEWDFPDLPVDLLRLDLQGYKVYRDGMLLNTELISELNYEDHAVENGVTYSYYVTAQYLEGESEPSNVVEATPEAPDLPSPSNLTYQILDYGSVGLQWDAPNYAELELEFIGYNVYRDEELINPAPVAETNYLDCGLDPDFYYYYYITALYVEGESEPTETIEVYVTSAHDDIFAPQTRLLGNYPNPFNPETTISFILAEAGYTTLEIYNVRGQKIRSIVTGYLDGGSHSISWNGLDSNNREAGSGVYFYKLQTGDYSTSKKMLLLK